MVLLFSRGLKSISGSVWLVEQSGSGCSMFSLSSFIGDSRAVKSFWRSKYSFTSSLCLGCHRAWYLEGNLHRTDGPALYNPSDGYIAWYIHGLPHRIDGPCGEYNLSNYPSEWAIYGKYYDNEEKYKKRIKYLRFKYFYKWLAICDQPGKKFFEISFEKNFQEVNSMYNN